MTARPGKSTRRQTRFVKTSGLNNFSPRPSSQENDKIASCEIRNEEQSQPGLPSEAHHQTSDATKLDSDPNLDVNGSDSVAATHVKARADDWSEPTAIDRAVERCRAIAAQNDSKTYTTWAASATDVLVAGLEFCDAFDRDNDAKDKVRAILKEINQDARALNKGNTELVAVHLCHPPGNKQQRKEWSRFANVLKAARLHGITPENAAAWLQNKTQAELLDAVKSASGKTSRVRIIATSKDVRPNIWNALQEGCDTRYEYAVTVLDELDRRLSASSWPPEATATRAITSVEA